MVKTRLEQVKILVIGKTYSWESVKWDSSLQEEDARVELPSE